MLTEDILPPKETKSKTICSLRENFENERRDYFRERKDVNDRESLGVASKQITTFKVDTIKVMIISPNQCFCVPGTELNTLCISLT